jgi:hypothetical protein
VVLRTANNRFDLDRSKIPPAMTYEWKRVTMFGQTDTENMVNCEANNWTAVPAERHPELSGRRAQVGADITRGGLILMERPSEYTEESRELEEFAARNQVATQVQRLGLEGKRAGGKGFKTTYDPPGNLQPVPD